MQATTLTPDQVCELCGNNEARIFRVARLIAGYWQQASWYVAALKICDQLNAGSDPAETLRSYLENDKV